MKDRLDALAELAADLRAVLEDEAARGVWAEPADAPLPEPIAPPEPVAVAEPAPAASPLARPAAAAPPASPTPTAPASTASAWAAMAQRARTDGPGPAVLLDRVRQDLGDCRRCELCRERRSIVFGVGDPGARLVVCGEAPGYHEDQKGEPFVGPAGEMLDKMLTNVLGLQRGQVYILNVVKCRPPKNRNPLPAEVAACKPFLDGQLDAIRPKLMLVLGSVALNALFGPGPGGITAARGRWLDYRGIPTLPTFHPAYLLRQPDDKRKTFEDLKVLKARYDALVG